MGTINIGVKQSPRLSVERMKKLLFCIYEFYVYIFLNKIIFKLIPFWTLRKLFIQPLATIKRHCQIDLSCCFMEPRRLCIGANTHINNHVILDARGWLTIGDNCSISYNVQIISGGHDPQSATFEGRHLPIIIEDCVWIGAGAIILQDVKIGKGAIVTAGAVVTKDVAPYEIVGGVPAKVIGHRNKELTYNLLDKNYWWPTWR